MPDYSTFGKRNDSRNRRRCCDCRTAKKRNRKNVATLTVKVGGQSRMILRFRRQIRAQFGPSRPETFSVGRGPVEHLRWQSERTGLENKWFALTGSVVAMKAEADGDLHIALADASGDKPGRVVCEVPAKTAVV